MTSLAQMTPEQRSVHMAKIRGRDTRPERVVQQLLVDAGVKFKTHVDDMVGTPDIVVESRKAVVFVHGCFWHRRGCRRGSTKVKANRKYWETKFAKNVARDRAAARSLRAAGWTVLTVWECEALRGLFRLVPRLLKALAPGRRMCEHGPHVAVEGRSLCATCATYNRERIRDGFSNVRRPSTKDAGKTSRRETLGLCKKCGLPAPDGAKRCFACRGDPRNRSRKKWLEDRHARGLCRCGQALAVGHKRCEDCLKQLRDDAKARADKRREAKECIHCGKPVEEGKTLCKKHLKKLRQANRRRAAREKSSRSQGTVQTSSATGTLSIQSSVA